MLSSRPQRGRSGVRPYTACGANGCKVWRYNDKAIPGEACICGARGSGSGAAKRDSKLGFTPEVPGEGEDELAVALQHVLRLAGAALPEEVLTVLQKKIGEAAAAANKGPEPVTVASARKAFAEANKVFKELVTKREQLSAKVVSQAKQLALAQGELDDTIGKLAEAKEAQAAGGTALELAGQAQGAEDP